MPQETSTRPAGTGLIVDGVRIDAGSTRILHDLSLTLRPGELCALIGPSGAGKSTFIKALLGLWTPDQGTVSCDGAGVGEAGAVGFVPQDDAVHRSLTARQALGFAARLRAPELSRDRVGRLVDGLCRRLDLSGRMDVRIKRLSGGQRKRVSVAMELITRPRVLVLDEPTSGLDPGLEAQLMELLAEVAAGGRVVLVATHAMQSLGLCDALLILMQGRLVYFGPPDAAPAHFGAHDYSGIFHRLAQHDARTWERSYRASAGCRAFRERPGPTPDSTPAAEDGGRVIFDRQAVHKRSTGGAARSPTRSRAGAAQGRFRQQATVLVQRYGASLAGDWITVALLLAQAPIIGWLCTLVWGSIERDTPSLYFVMSLAAVWLGCTNACREIVKERAIFERERLIGLSPPAYVGSKLLVLAILGLTQVLALQITIEWQLALRGAFVLQTLALWGASLCGVGLGLLVSAVASTQERAVAAVPLLLLPQILFSKFVLPSQYFSDTAAAIEKLMPVHWSFDVFEQAAATSPDWARLALGLLVPFVYVSVLAALTGLALLRRKEI